MSIRVPLSSDEPREDHGSKTHRTRVKLGRASGRIRHPGGVGLDGVDVATRIPPADAEDHPCRDPRPTAADSSLHCRLRRRRADETRVQRSRVQLLPVEKLVDCFTVRLLHRIGLYTCGGRLPQMDSTISMCVHRKDMPRNIAPVQRNCIEHSCQIDTVPKPHCIYNDHQSPISLYIGLLHTGLRYITLGLLHTDLRSNEHCKSIAF